MYFVGGVLGDEGHKPLLDGTEDGTAVSPLSAEVSKLSTKPPRKKFKKGKCLQAGFISGFCSRGGKCLVPKY